MVDIVIGSVPALSNSFAKPDRGIAGVEVKILNVRSPRNRGEETDAAGDRRRHKEKDPSGSHVLTILVPATHPLPKDLDSGKYRVQLHIARRGT